MRYFLSPLIRRALIPVSLLVLSAGVSAIELAAGLPQSQGMSPTRLARIHDLMQTEVTENRVPGAVVLVARKGKIVYADALGFQDKPSSKPMTRDAIFRAYSMTKPLVSVLTMMLVEEGRLQLNDPVSKFFPSMAKMNVLLNPADGNSERVPAGRLITIHDLLRHTSGITYAEFTRFTAIKGPYQEA